MGVSLLLFNLLILASVFYISISVLSLIAYKMTVVVLMHIDCLID